MTDFRKFYSEEDNSISANFNFTFPDLERLKKLLTLASTRRRRQERAKEQQKSMSAEEKRNSSKKQSSIVTFSEDDLVKVKESLTAENTKKSTASAIRRLQAWYKERHGSDLDLNKISKKEAPQLLKHFFVEIRQTTKDGKGKEYEPGSLQTYRNGLRRYFLDRPCPPAPDDFDIEKTSGIEFEEVAAILSLKKKDLKKKGLGNKPNAAKPVENDEIEKMWTSGAIGLKTPRSLLQLVWWNNVTHLGMRGFKEQHDCQLEDFTVTDQFVE